MVYATTATGEADGFWTKQDVCRLYNPKTSEIDDRVIKLIHTGDDSPQVK